MKHLTIIVPNGENNLSSIVGAYKIFSRLMLTKKKLVKKKYLKLNWPELQVKLIFMAVCLLPGCISIYQQLAKPIWLSYHLSIIIMSRL
jgi:hypothetical protein